MSIISTFSIYELNYRINFKLSPTVFDGIIQKGAVMYYPILIKTTKFNPCFL